MDLKDRIKDLRKQKGWTQADLSKRTGISMGMIGGIENGTRNPSDKTLNKISTAFNVTPEWLKTGEDRNNSLVQDFLKRLIDEGIVKDTELDNETKDMILKTVEAEIALLLKKKNDK